MLTITLCIVGALTGIVSLFNNTREDGRFTRTGWIAIALLVLTAVIGVAKEWKDNFEAKNSLQIEADEKNALQGKLEEANQSLRELTQKLNDAYARLEHIPTTRSYMAAAYQVPDDSVKLIVPELNKGFDLQAYYVIDNDNNALVLSGGNLVSIVIEFPTSFTPEPDDGESDPVLFYLECGQWSQEVTIGEAAEVLMPPLENMAPLTIRTNSPRSKWIATIKVTAS